jgi:hypothetical protein
MRELLDLKPLALLVLVAGVGGALALNLSVFLFALVCGPISLLAQLVNGDKPSISNVAGMLSVSLALFIVGLTLSALSGQSFFEFVNRGPTNLAVRYIAFPALFLASYGLGRLLMHLFIRFDNDEDD